MFVKIYSGVTVGLALLCEAVVWLTPTIPTDFKIGLSLFIAGLVSYSLMKLNK